MNESTSQRNIGNGTTSRNESTNMKVNSNK
jgi:hypothetical protein